MCPFPIRCSPAMDGGGGPDRRVYPGTGGSARRASVGCVPLQDPIPSKTWERGRAVLVQELHFLYLPVTPVRAPDVPVDAEGPVRIFGN